MVAQAVTGVPFNKVQLLLHMDGADQSTTFTDVKGKTITVNGNAKIAASAAKYGTGGGLFDGTGDYLTVTHASLASGSQSFSISGWLRVDSLAAGRTMIASRPSTASQLNAFSVSISTSGALIFWMTSGANMQAAGVITAGVYNHVEINHNAAANTTRMYLNGAQVAQMANTPNFDLTTMSIGALGNGAEPLLGALDDIRYTVGAYAHWANFTPPTGPYPDS